MTLRTNIEIMVNFDYIQCKRLIREGYIRFTLNLYFTETRQGQTSKIICCPFNIIKNSKQQPKTQQSGQTQDLSKQSSGLQMKIKQTGEEQMLLGSKIDYKDQQYHSPVLYMKCSNPSYEINQTCCFKAYLDSQQFNQLYKKEENQGAEQQQDSSNRASSITLKCKSKLYFSQSLSEQRFTQIGNFGADIKSNRSIGCFLPLTFDTFAGFQVCGSFHSTILQFKFEGQQQKKSILNFQSFLDKTTHFQPKKLRNLYNFYRSALEEELRNTQQRFQNFLEIILKSQDHHYQLEQQVRIKDDLNNLQNQEFHYGISPTLKKFVVNLKFSEELGRFTDKSPKKTNNYQPISYKELLKVSKSIRNKKKNQIPVNTKIIRMLQKISQDSEELKRQISQLIIQDFSLAKVFLYENWNQYLIMVHQNSKCLTQHLKKQYDLLVIQRFKSNIFSHKIANHDRRFCKYQDSGKSHIQCSNRQKMKEKNESSRELWHESHAVQAHKFFEGENRIKFFEQIYLSEEASLSLTSSTSSFRESFQLKKIVTGQSQHKAINSLRIIETKATQQMHNKKHVIILVHGFQASRLDFRKLKSCLQINYQDIQVMLSFSNEQRTHQSIQILGKRLAVQIATFLSNLQSSQFATDGKLQQSKTVSSVVEKISFIGHSMGGLIIRSALVYLKNLQEKLFTYISICTPHLGYLYQPTPLVQAGLWLINTWNKCDSINQLSMADFDTAVSATKQQKMKSSFLYKLSKKKTLMHFKNICFMTSSQDQYVPYESARVQKNMRLFSQASSNSERKLITQMVDAIFNDLSGVKQISRIDVIFNDIQKNFDSFIGRTGHVLFLSDEQFIKQFVMCFDKFFK